MNTFLDALKKQFNYTRTTNGALAYKSTNSAVYDMFAFGGAYRNRSNDDCVLLFANAFEENPLLALRCLFYLRDCRGGAGERRFFRVCYRWLAENHRETAIANLNFISEFGRWDDLYYCTLETPIEQEAMDVIKHQLALDVSCKTPSLLAKWLPSENASSPVTKAAAHIIRSYLGMTHKEYRKTLSYLREKINIVERLMSANEWDKIEFDKIPSKAGLIYRNAFARRDILKEKYRNFIMSDNTKVNADTLYPYDIVRQALREVHNNDFVERTALDKYWTNLPNYAGDKDCKILCVVDTSGSMNYSGNKTVKPIDVAISLGIYCGERIKGDFNNYYISFSSHPELVKIEGVDIYDKVRRAYNSFLMENTDIEAVFNLLKNTVLSGKANPKDLPESIIIISDMQIDAGSYWGSESEALTEMERIRADWEASGLTMPKLIYWNVNASNDTILDAGKDVTFVSGASPSILKQILSGKTGIDLMLETLRSDRYSVINID